MRRQVTCIRKRGEHYDPHQRIEAIGGPGWYHTEANAIRRIKSGDESYFVNRGGSTTDVIVASRLGREYLKTRADGESPDNLLALDECP